MSSDDLISVVKKAHTCQYTYSIRIITMISALITSHSLYGRQLKLIGLNHMYAHPPIYRFSNPKSMQLMLQKIHKISSDTRDEFRSTGYRTCFAFYDALSEVSCEMSSVRMTNEKGGGNATVYSLIDNHRTICVWSERMRPRNTSFDWTK